jgi:hypothetical protein
MVAGEYDDHCWEEVDVQFTKDHTVRRLLCFGLGVATALALTACGGSSSSSSHAAAVTGVPTTAPTTATTTSTATTTATPGTTQATTTPSGPPPCRAASLSLSFLGGQGATGHGELGFALRNTGAATCSTYGYPGVLFLDRGGHSLPTTPAHTTHDFFGSLTKAQLTVAPGATVSFRLGVTHGIASTAGCTTAYGLQVIPPNDTATVRTTIANGAYECQTATVSPLQRGTSAFP